MTDLQIFYEEEFPYADNYPAWEKVTDEDKRKLEKSFLYSRWRLRQAVNAFSNAVDIEGKKLMQSLRSKF